MLYFENSGNIIEYNQRECSLPVFVVKSNVFPIEALAGNGGENCSHRPRGFSHHGLFALFSERNTF